MKATRSSKNAWKSALGLCAASTLLGSSCGLTELQAISAGLDAAASSLDRYDSDDDITFGDWLRDELGDL